MRVSLTVGREMTMDDTFGFVASVTSDSRHERGYRDLFRYHSLTSCGKVGWEIEESTSVSKGVLKTFYYTRFLRCKHFPLLLAISILKYNVFLIV